MSIATCPGLCCRTFPLNPSLEEALEGAIALYGFRSVSGHRILDDEQIIDLLEINPDEPGHYRCTKYDAATRRCTDYENRPDLCRSYPYGRPCEYCTFDDREPSTPGLPWPKVEDTGVFSAWDAQLCGDAA